ncbi:MAG: hypothetical protein MUF58_02960 [Arcicella sp.]|jgi:hypothetical protein|nr:hypothetical protein [Arcicella sp.]
MKKIGILIISLLLVLGCSDFRKNKGLNKLHIGLELMVISENNQGKRVGYAILGKVKNLMKKDIAFPNQVFQIEYQNERGRWEKIYSDSYFVGMNDKGFHPYELEEMNSFRKHDKDDIMKKNIIKKIDFPVNEYNINQLRISSVYFSLLKQDSTILFSRSIDEYLDFSSDFFKKNIKKGNYRVFFRNREDPTILKLQNQNNGIEKVKIGKSIGNFEIINQVDITSDTLIIRVW